MTMKKSKLIKFISAISFVFILVLSVFSFAFTSSTINTESSTSSPSFSIYFVSTAKSQLESEASSLANDVISSGGGGYVWQNGNYFYVISSAYENKNDATLISNKLSNENISNEVFEVSFPSFSFPLEFEKSEEKNVFVAGINLFYSSFKDLFDVSISLDTSLYDETKALIEINRLQAKADEVMKNFNLIFQNTENKILTSLEDAIVDENETLGLLAEKQMLTEKQSLLSLIRYSYTKICAIYHNFLEKIQ